MKLNIATFIFILGGMLSTGYSQIKIEVLDDDLKSIINVDAKSEIIATGLTLSEGPLWVESEKMLLFSDVPANVIYKWTQKNGQEKYLSPSGFTGKNSKAEGSNGLVLNKKSQLVLCQHGDRKIALMNAPLNKPVSNFITLADNYKEKKFDSPNDLTYGPAGNLYFTDPPYGLKGMEKDSTKAAPYQGVYMLSKNGKVTLLVDSLTRPNGIAFFPDGKTALVANSDGKKPVWYIYDVNSKGLFNNGRIFYDASKLNKKERGAPDGLKIDKQGIVYASGPGGIWIFSKSGKVLGKIRFAQRVTNCALSADEKTLFVTTGMEVLKIGLRD